MPIFHIKHIEVPLFGVIEKSDPSDWLTAFSSPGTSIPIVIDDAALDFIAEDLGLDAEGLIADAERYAQGKYRPKAQGLTGSRLGDLGEVLTYLLSRHQGQVITRVISWRADATQAVKGSRFPQPDFLVSDSAGVAALEVKATEAFDFLELRDRTKRWRYLQPCSSVESCRANALPQLAYVGGVSVRQRHKLVQQDGVIVPFPVGKGIANAVVAVDGRANLLRIDQKYKTPKRCRTMARDCWTCVPDDRHVVVVTMPNAPAMLSLGGSTAGPKNWIRAYTRWTQALESRNLPALRHTLSDLTEHIELWLSSGDAAKRRLLRNFWGSYLGDAMQSRGLPVDAPQEFGTLRRAGSRFNWEPAPLSDPVAVECNPEDIELALGQEAYNTAFVRSAPWPEAASRKGTMTVSRDQDWIALHYMSNAWWEEQQVMKTEDAKVIASSLLSFLLKVTGWRGPVTYPAYLKKVTTRVGEHSIFLGWEWKPASHEDPALRPYRYRGPAWLVGLALDDPRVRLRIRPDGRASLRMPNTFILDQRR